jgi:hypothetical protein
VFSIAFVLGALPPTAVPIPLSIGLLTVGFAALTAQLVYVATLLRPLPAADPRAVAEGTAPEP